MSLEKEAAIFLESNKMTASSPTWDRDDKLVFIHDFLVDFATQQTKELSTELEQTKEKLKSCEEFIDKLKDEVFEGKSKITGRLQMEGEQLLTQLKDNG